MRKIDRLRKEALQSCNFRGHKMTRFYTFNWQYAGSKVMGIIPHSAYSTCKICGARVDINTTPAPNQIDIGGTAVALNCPAGKEWL